MSNSSETIQNRIWIAAGFLSTGIGIVGYIVPMMPGLVFFLIAAYCFSRGSKKFLYALLRNKYVGATIRDYFKGRGIRMNTKIFAIVTINASIIFSILYLTDKDWLRVVMGATALGVSIYIMTFKTRRD